LLLPSPTATTCGNITLLCSVSCYGGASQARVRKEKAPLSSLNKQSAPLPASISSQCLPQAFTPTSSCLTKHLSSARNLRPVIYIKEASSAILDSLSLLSPSPSSTLNQQRIQRTLRSAHRLTLGSAFFVALHQEGEHLPLCLSSPFPRLTVRSSFCLQTLRTSSDQTIRYVSFPQALSFSCIPLYTTLSSCLPSASKSSTLVPVAHLHSPATGLTCFKASKRYPVGHFHLPASTKHSQ